MDADGQPLLTTLYIVRHGETEYNLQDILQGQTDSALTKYGEQQARKLARQLKQTNFDAVFASDLLRARRTAEIVALERKLTVNTSQLLRERNWGRYDGVLAETFRQESKQALERFEQLTQEEQWKFKYGQDIESFEEIYARLTQFMRQVALAYPGKTVLIVSHLDVLRTLLIRSGKRPRDIDNMSYAVFLSDGVTLHLERVSGITFFDEDRQPTVKTE